MKSSEYEKVLISYFYDLYKKANIRHRENTYDRDSKKIGRRIIPFKLFREIIYTFLNFYFFDFYSSKSSVYFLFGGYLKKVSSGKGVRDRNANNQPEKVLKRRTISWFWFLRPNQRLRYMVSITKMTGSTNMIPKIEEWYRRNYDIDKLPTFNDEKKKKRSNNTLHR